MSAELDLHFTELESDRLRLRGILDGLVEGVIAVGGSDEIAFANERAGHLLDFSPERDRGRKLWEVVRHRPLLELATSASKGREAQRGEFEGKPGSPYHLAAYAAPLTDGLIVVVHDVGELRRLEGLRQEFVANVSHELKTPLTAIVAGVESLLDGAADDPSHRTMFLKQIGEQAERLHALILDLLSLAQIESAGHILELTTVEVDSLVADCLSRYRSLAQANGVIVTAVPPSKPVTVIADEEALDTVVKNLVDNAIKYTPNGGKVSVSWGTLDRTTWLEVSDTGIGIPEADQPRIFERFYRVDKARSRELGGTGLGLSIVKHLMLAMNGTVTVVSKPGLGSTFRVSLPVA